MGRKSKQADNEIRTLNTALGDADRRGDKKAAAQLAEQLGDARVRRASIRDDD